MVLQVKEQPKHRVILLIIVLAYAGLAVAYAVLTPPWQVPDEPAHFNYIRYVAEEKRLPVLSVGDYPQAYLEHIKALHFPPEMPIDSIRYEAHQPPLYYLLASVWYAPLRGLPLAQQVIGLRLLSVLVGVGILVMGGLTVHELLPRSPDLVIGTVAFVAFVPMHIAFTAGVNNDPLAELVLVSILWQLMRLLDRGLDLPHTILLGITIGLALLTKTTAYVSVPLAVIAVFMRARRSREFLRVSPKKSIIAQIALILLPALPIALPWLIRNASIYGPGDPLALQRHDQVVLGQLTTSDFVSQVGTLSYLQAFAVTTFRSFWAQFGWMGILIDRRIYVALAISCLYVTLGAVLFIVDLIRRPGRFARTQMQGLALLAASTVLTVGSYLWYNTKFVQFQGRYLFPTIVPIGLWFSLGLRELLADRWSRVLTYASATITALAALARLALPDIGNLPLALSAGVLVFSLGRGFVPKWLARAIPSLVHGALLALAVVCLWGFIVPYFD